MGVSMQKIAFLSFFTKQQQIAVKTISAHSQSTILIYKILKKPKNYLVILSLSYKIHIGHIPYQKVVQKSR